MILFAAVTFCPVTILPFVAALGLAAASPQAGPAPVVFQTDFGTRDGAVAAMKGVAVGVDPAIPLFDLTHEIPAYNIWEAAYRLKQTVPFWPTNTVFVSVCDPGVGTDRRPVVARTRTGHRIVTPDNGTLTFIAETLGLDEIRIIDAARQRLKGSEDSYTFHGRDLFAFVAARLATGELAWTDIGPLSTNAAVRIPYQHAERSEGRIRGNVPVLDPQYGNVWSNIPQALFRELKPALGDAFDITIRHAGKTIWTGRAPYVASFGNVPPGKPLLYINSLLEVAVALNQENFARTHAIASGPDWSIELRRADTK
jgi:S-adenosylmethionine hydrolase